MSVTHKIKQWVKQRKLRQFFRLIFREGLSEKMTSGLSQEGNSDIWRSECREFQAEGKGDASFKEISLVFSMNYKHPSVVRAVSEEGRETSNKTREGHSDYIM